MKRTTKRRLGLAGLVVAGMIMSILVLSTRVEIWLKWEGEYPGNPFVEMASEMSNERAWANPILWCTNFAVYVQNGSMIIYWDEDCPDFPKTWQFGFSNLDKYALPWLPFIWRNPGRIQGLGLPLWIPTLIIAIPSLLLFRRNRKLGEGFCECGYDLTGNVSGVCSECGKKLLANGDSLKSVDED